MYRLGRPMVPGLAPSLCSAIALVSVLVPPGNRTIHALTGILQGVPGTHHRMVIAAMAHIFLLILGLWSVTQGSSGVHCIMTDSQAKLRPPAVASLICILRIPNHQCQYIHVPAPQWRRGCGYC